MRFRYWALRIAGCAMGLGVADAALANEKAASQCPVAEVTDHVRELFARFGPQSSSREYFGFVFRLDGKIESAVVRSSKCTSDDRCTTNTAGAARAIPRGARVLGEWHTHPAATGSRGLSAEDVRGARNNRHIPCYRAYYSTPAGDIYAWDAGQSSVPTAMNSREHVGNFRPAIIPAHEEPGSECLSTNTNAHTADTTTRYCKRSATSP